MEELVARCPACGNEQPESFAHCFVCMSASRWWCRACLDWRPARACPACAGGVGVPAELFLGSCTVGCTVVFKVAARNGGKKLLSCAVGSPDGGVAITNPRFVIPPGGTADVLGGVTLPPGPLGRRTFRLRFAAPVAAETLLVVEAMAAAPRLDFSPAAVALRTLSPGVVVRSSVVLKNTGNVPVAAAISSSARWLAAEPKSLTLAPGESADVKLRARSKKTDSGTLEATLTAGATGGPYEAAVRLALPDPELTVEPVSFGELRPGRAAFAEVVVRNTGRVRVDCTVAPAGAWLRASPGRINLPGGREKVLRVRAQLAADQDGPQASELVFTSAAGVVARVPVSAVGKVPRPVLRAVRRQRFRNALGPPVERKFQVANDGDGRLDVTATADRPWVRILTPELRVAPGKRRKLRYELDIPSLPRGEHSATIALESNGGSAAVPITAHVLDPNPVLEVLPAPELGTITPDLALSAFVQVRNAGIGLLTVKARSEWPRARVSPAEAAVPSGPPVRFNLAVPLDGLPGGEHELGVRFSGNGGEGRAAVRFRLPVELIDAPALSDLGERPAGRLTGDALRVTNKGPDRVSLRVRGGDPWVRPAVEQVALQPGEAACVPFRMDLPPGKLGPIMTSLVLQGRALRQAVAVRVVARKVELVAVPSVVRLGEMAPGEERALTVDLLNAGEMAAEVRELHAPGDLEVWVRRATVRPGERVTLACRVRINSRQPRQQVRASVRLADEATVRFEAKVVPSVVPKWVAAGAAASGLVAGGILSALIGWWAGIPLVLLGLATGAWLLWLDTP
jgi:hypothetical protein